MFFTWYQYVINGRKGIRVGQFHSIHQYAKANNKYMRELESPYLQYWNVNNLYGCKNIQ